jgi:hypothetical protein
MHTHTHQYSTTYGVRARHVSRQAIPPHALAVPLHFFTLRAVPVINNQTSLRVTPKQAPSLIPSLPSDQTQVRGKIVGPRAHASTEIAHRRGRQVGGRQACLNINTRTLIPLPEYFVFVHSSV